MSVHIQDLTDPDVLCLTRLLCRRPEYGIAIPSAKWLRRQEQKISDLPKALLRTTNPLKRLIIKLSDALDADVVDPQAVLCRTHAPLNSFLMRRIFLALAYEVTVHSDHLRSWRGIMDSPVLLGLVARLDAIAALWTQPDLYRQCYGVSPFQNHLVHVQSGCEACIVAAIGANAQLLGDLRAILLDRMERRAQRKPLPRLYRIVKDWIFHLKEKRAAECEAMSEEVLVALRGARPGLKDWRRESKSLRPSMYTELKRHRKDGQKHRLSNVPRDGPYKRRTRHGIPVALADREGAEEQRRTAAQSNANGMKSVFRPDSMCDFSQVGEKQRAAYDIPVPQPGDKAQISPSGSFVERFDRDVGIRDGDDRYDGYGEEAEIDEFDERDYEQEERSRTKVQDWYASRLGENHANPVGDDTKSTLSMIHPAFRPANVNTTATTETYSFPSAVPPPLQLMKDRDPRSSTPRQGARGAKTDLISSVWTDATVYTVDPSEFDPGAGATADTPPIPQMPSRFRDDSEQHPDTNNQTSAHTTSPKPQTPRTGSFPRASPAGFADTRRPTDIPSSSHTDPFGAEAAATAAGGKSGKRGARSPSPPPQLSFTAPTPVAQAPEQQPPANPMKKPTTKYLFEDSDVGSRLTTTQRQYLKNRRGMKDYSKEENPFTAAGAGSRREEVSSKRAPSNPQAEKKNGGASTDDGNDAQQRQASQDSNGGQPVPSSIRSLPSLSSSHGNTVNEDGDKSPIPRAATAAQDERAWREGWGIRDDETDFDPVRPDDSASNVMWRRTAAQMPDDVTQLGNFFGGKK